jgi:hypothetical protein
VQTMTMLTSSVDPATSGQSVTFTANMLAAAASVAAPTGGLRFWMATPCWGRRRWLALVWRALVRLR